MNVILNEISIALQEGQAKEVKALIEKAFAENISADDILKFGLLAGMDVIAVKFKNNEVFVPEVLISARAMHMGSALLKPHLAKGNAQAIGKAVLGTVKGDLHDIGKNLVRMMLEGKGIEVIDLGVDVPPEKFVEVCKTERPQIVALSALLTTTMGEMKTTIDALRCSGIKGLTTMIGGAPVTEGFAKSIGANLYAADAATAAEAAKQAILAKS